MSFTAYSSLIKFLFKVYLVRLCDYAVVVYNGLPMDNTYAQPALVLITFCLCARSSAGFDVDIPQSTGFGPSFGLAIFDARQSCLQCVCSSHFLSFE